MFPTKFAISLARKYRIYSEHNPKRLASTHKEYHDAVELHLCLEEFQKFALTSDLEDALVAYIDIDVSEPRVMSGLEKIYRHTRIWVRGQVVEDLLANMDTDPKAMAAIAELVLETAKSETKESKSDSEPKMIIRLNHKGKEQ